MDGRSRVPSQSLAEPRSEPKVSAGQKRGIEEVEETSESFSKKVKMRDLDSVFRSEGKGGNNTLHPNTSSDSRTLDLNINVGSVSGMHCDGASACIEESNKLSRSQKEETELKRVITKSRGFELDLNVEDIGSSINDPFYAYKNYDNLKSKDDSECGSSVGLLDEKDSMRVWKGLKQNNYMSIPHGAVRLPIPKPRGRKKYCNDVMKKRIELAKKEQVDRFARVAAPSGLLNGLNPGIINHVRNSKQVHSIIEALVRSKQSEDRNSVDKQGNQIKNGAREVNERKGLEDVHGSGVNRHVFSRGGNLSGLKQMTDSAFLPKSVYSNTGGTRRVGDLHLDETRMLYRMSPEQDMEKDDDGLALKLSSFVKDASENISCLSNDDSRNLNSVNSLSVKAANVASQWLELLSQDIKGRLGALRRSKNRVQAVINTDLLSLISREFSNLEKAAADAHVARWSTLFGQMDNALSEEENHLVSWLSQVKEMQLHCERGLHNSSHHPHALQQMGAMGYENSRAEVDSSERDMAVQAAAASIYSTCNFLLSKENLPCC